MSIDNRPLVSGVGEAVVSYPTFASFPATGQQGTLYIDKTNSDLYLWTGSAYELQGGGGGNDPRIRIFKTSADVSGAVGVDQTVSDLSCTLDANKSYYIEVFVRFNTAAAALWTISHRPTYTGTITSLYATVGGAQVSNQNILSQPPASGFLLGTSIGANNTDFSPGHCFIGITTAGSATTFTYAFRSASVICVLKANSHMRVTELA